MKFLPGLSSMCFVYRWSMPKSTTGWEAVGACFCFPLSEASKIFWSVHNMVGSFYLLGASKIRIWKPAFGEHGESLGSSCCLGFNRGKMKLLDTYRLWNCFESEQKTDCHVSAFFRSVQVKTQPVTHITKTQQTCFIFIDFFFLKSFLKRRNALF